MNKSDLISKLAKENAHLPYTDCKQVVSTIFEEISKSLIREQRVELRGFGVFYTRQKPARTARNPSTGEKLKIGARTSIHFRPGKLLRKKVDQTKT